MSRTRRILNEHDREMMISDTDARGRILASLYKLRSQGEVALVEATLKVDLSNSEILRISDQLIKHGLIEGELQPNFTGQGGEFVNGMGKISAHGVDVQEGSVQPKLSVNIVSTNITVSNSQGVVVGDNNTQNNLGACFSQIIERIDRSDGTASEKNEAKGILRKLVENPLVSTILGAAATAILGNIKL